MADDEGFSPVARYEAVLAEHQALVRALDPAQVDDLVEALLGARRVFFSGQGRSGLMIRAVAIRLMHVGLVVHVAGEPSTPSTAEGDVLVAVSASGSTQATQSHLAAARRSGARTVLVSTRAGDGPDRVIVLPVRSAVATDQHAGSLFEQAVLLLGDAVCWAIQRRLRVPDSDLDGRHANLQ